MRRVTGIRRSFYSGSSCALLLLLVKISPAHSACPERCDGGACVLRTNFTECNQVVCDNTGVTSEVGSCQSSTFNKTGSTVECIAGACRNSEFMDSKNVTCNGVGNSCGFGRFERSNVACFDDSCSDARFYYSKATCDSYSSCANPVFFSACSCCDGDSCPYGGYPPSCKTDPVGFCKTTYLGRNCQEWGSPICVGLNIEPTGTNVAICDSGDCQGQDFSDASVYCDNSDATSTCQRTSFSGSEAACDAGACQDSQFSASNVTCFDTTGEGSCNNAVVNLTRIVCKDTACANIDFHSSALTCEGYSSCEGALGFSCSCCYDYCPDSTQLKCTDTLEFCKTIYLGRTCKEWGNPVCENVAIAPTGRQVAICTQGECFQADFDGTALLCDNKNNPAAVDTCNAIVVRESIVVCDAGACPMATFSDSTVDCTVLRVADGSGSCESSSFQRSNVSCYETSCTNAVFTASAVNCDSYDSCEGTTFDTCSCCDGIGCYNSITTDVPSCTTAIPVDFCTTCASKGNPICAEKGGLNGTVPSASTLAPAPASVTTTAPVVSVSTSVPVESVTTSAPVESVVTSAPSPPVSLTELPSPLLTTTEAPSRYAQATGKPSPNDALTPGPASVALPPSGTETQVPATSSTKGDLNPSNDTAFETPANTPIDIPSSSTDKGGTVDVTAWPRNGSLNVKGDRTITYTPNSGFVGEDAFEIERCNVDGQCESVTITVQVQASADGSSPTTSPSSSSSNGLYALSLLVLVPIVICAVLFRKMLGWGKTTDGEDGSQQGGPASTANASIPEPPHQAYLPTNKDQVRTVIQGDQVGGPNVVNADDRMIAAAVAPTTQIAVRQRQDPPSVVAAAVPMNHQAAAAAMPHENGLLPDYKDQCRADARVNAPQEPPLANVVFVEAVNDAVDQPVVVKLEL